MQRVFKAATLLAVATSVLMRSAPAAVGENPCLSVLVYNDAQISASILAGAERRAAMIFSRWFRGKLDQPWS